MFDAQSLATTKILRQLKVEAALQIGKLLKFLLAPQLPLWRYCQWLFLLAFLPATYLTAFVDTALTLLGIDTSALYPNYRVDLEFVFAAIIFAPIVETLLMAVGIYALSALTQRTLLIATASGVVWGCLHALSGFLALFATGWVFFVLSCAYMAWRKRSFWHAFLAAAVPHALVNLFAVSLSLLDKFLAA